MKKSYKNWLLRAVIFTFLICDGYLCTLIAEETKGTGEKQGESPSKLSSSKEKGKGDGKGLGSRLGERYFDMTKGFSFRPPKGWQKVTPDDSEYLTFRSPKMLSGFYSSVTVQVEKWPASLATYVVQSVENLRKQMPGCEIKYEGSLRISGKEAYQICNTSLFRQMNSVFTIRNLQILAVAYGRVYIISFSTLERDFANSKKLFDLSASTFRVARRRYRERIPKRVQK